jgi:O-antigen/teichoic acid export membrane protein
MGGKPDAELLNKIIVVAVNGTLNVLLIPKYGINGAAVATSVALCLVNGLRVLQNYRYFAITPFSFSRSKMQ